MPHDHDEKPQAPKAQGPRPKAQGWFDPGTLPRWRPKFLFTPDDPPGKPPPTQTGQPAPGFDPDIVPWVEPAFRIATDESRTGCTPREPARTAAQNKRTGQDWSARAIARRATEPPSRADRPVSESQAALRAFLDAAEAEAQIETPLAEDDQGRPP